MENTREISVECPNCNSNFDIPINELKKYLNLDSSNKYNINFNIIIALCFLLFISCIAFIFVFIINLNKNEEINEINNKLNISESELNNTKYELKKTKEKINTYITNAKAEAEMIKEEAQAVLKTAKNYENNAKEEAQKIINNAKTYEKNTKEEAQKIINYAKTNAKNYENNTDLMKNGMLHKVYPSLRKYNDGENIVNQQYIKSFRITNNKVLFKLYNRGIKGSRKPNFTLYVINDFGFCIGETTVEWIFDNIQPGEERVEEKFLRSHINNDYLNPVYYIIEYND